MKKIILNILDSLGVYIEDDIKEQDFDLRDYLIDSIQYITFIVTLETELGICYPDEMLSMDSLASFSGFCGTVEALVSKQSESESL